MNRQILTLVSLLLAACASQPRLGVNAALLQDALFAPPAEPIDISQALALSPAMQELLDHDFQLRHGGRDPQGWLLRAMAQDGPLALHYDSSLTRNAAQAFDSHSGNCLSLTLMTGAFAKRLGLPVRYQSVYIADSWSRSGDLNLASGHVNLALGSYPLTGTRIQGDTPGAVVIDFLPAEELRGQRTRAIREETVLAMYLNNRAAEQLALAQLDQAYAFVRAAIHQDPSFLNSYNTLGVIYLRHGRLPEAERSLRYALSLEPENTSAMSNLVQVLTDQGKTAEAQQLAAQLAAIDPNPPFYFFDQGLAAMKQGDYAAAKQLFKRELRRAAYYHEFHFWLALADLGLGDPDRARKHLGIALENSATPQDHAFYAAKLDWLKQRRVQ
ncbi:MAG: tetratricopeptide repeat protein [Stagnimonas sp.]|nr:tetratricopeptide repeat protein [Stagnimonas sp.]